MGANNFSDTKSVGLYESAIGEKNQDYYLSKFEDFDDRGPGLHASWNWAAFFFTGFWSLYRKMYVWFFAWWAVGTVLTVYAKVQNAEINQILGIVAGVLWIAFTLYANTLYHRKIKAKIAAAQKSGSDASRLSRKLSAGGGVNKWVPLVCGAVPVIGVVAAIALPAYQDYTKGQGSGSVKPAATEPTSSLELKPFSGSLDGERKPDFSFTPDEDQRLLEDRKILMAQGVGGNQSLTDVSAWGESQLAARIFSETDRKIAHDFTLMWQRQIIHNLNFSPERALFLGYSVVATHLDQKKGICRPDMTKSGGIEDLPDGTFKANPECTSLE